MSSVTIKRIGDFLNSIEQLRAIEESVKRLNEQLIQYEETVSKEREQLQTQNAFEQDVLHLIEGLETNSIDSMLLIDQLRKNRQVRRQLKNGQTFYQRVKDTLVPLKQELEAFESVQPIDYPTYSLRTEAGYELSKMLQPMEQPETHFVFAEQDVFEPERPVVETMMEQKVTEERTNVVTFERKQPVEKQETPEPAKRLARNPEIEVTETEMTEQELEEARVVEHPEATEFHMKRDEKGWRLYKNGQPVLTRRKLKRMLELIQEQSIAVYVQHSYRKQAEQLLAKLS